MNNIRFLLVGLMIFLSALNLTGQTESFDGLWEIKKVSVGDQEMTPVAKWTRIHADGSYEAGNGWLQNAVGTWTYEPESDLFLPRETEGLEDPFGPFQVKFTADGMQWQRQEEGMIVTVHLQRTENLPQGPADQVVGLWELMEVAVQDDGGLQPASPEDKHTMFIRWDRIYIERTPEGERSTGYWHMHGHRPEMTLLPHQKGTITESWQVSFTEEGHLRRTGNSDSNRDEIRIYQRLNRFPE